MKLCWLLTTYRSHAASSRRRPSLVSDKHVPACRFKSVSSGAAVHWFGFYAARSESERCILLWCLAAKTVAARHLSSCSRLAFQRITRAQEQLAAVTQDSRLHTRRVASQQTGPQFCRLQFIESLRNAFVRNSKGCQALLMSCGY